VCIVSVKVAVEICFLLVDMLLHIDLLINFCYMI